MEGVSLKMTKILIDLSIITILNFFFPKLLFSNNYIFKLTAARRAQLGEGSYSGYTILPLPPPFCLRVFLRVNGHCSLKGYEGSTKTSLRNV